MAFLAYTSLFTAMLAACHALVGRALHLRHLRPSRWLTGTLAVLAAAWFAALIVPSTYQHAPGAARAARADRGLPDYPAPPRPATADLDTGPGDPGPPHPWSRLGLLAALPVTATAVYGLAGATLASTDPLRALHQARI